MTKFEAMETKDYAMIEQLQKAAEMAATTSPRAVSMSTEGDYTVVRFPSVDGRNRTTKIHKPGTFLEPEK